MELPTGWQITLEGHGHKLVLHPPEEVGGEIGADIFPPAHDDPEPLWPLPGRRGA